MGHARRPQQFSLDRITLLCKVSARLVRSAPMDPLEAISRVRAIREQLARAETYRAYRAGSTAATGAMALLAAAVQARWQLNDTSSFLILWSSVAALCIIIVGIEMRLRCIMSDSILLREATVLAARQFAPSVLAGALLTLAIWRFRHESVGLLPGLWGLLFAMGVFASRPGLPAAINVAGAYYMLAGVAVLILASNRPEFEIWPMPLMFGVGQLLIAAIIFFSLRKHDDPSLE
ncbi:hypothetical protein [Fontivita pretiosa]|uniref:hypothetical protein n=1 Tax=Fontivita pretiosa TaxID=2989684 RepID=UPI003D17807A